MVEIKQYTLADLSELVHSNSFWNGDLIPITKHRALSQVKNPRAHPEDVVLLVARDGDTICGFTGVLPDLIFLPEETLRVGWLTAWWRKPGSRYAGIGSKLLMRALELYQGAICVEPPSESARKVLERSGQFVTLQENTEVRAIIRVNTRSILSRKIPALKKFGLFLGLPDSLANIFCRARLRFWTARHGISGALRVEYITAVDPETADFVNKLRDHDLHRMGAPELNWIAQSPWILTAPLKEGTVKNYYFSATAKESLCLMIKILESKGSLIGFAILTLINGHLRVPYCYMQPEHADEVFRVIGEHAVALRAESLTLGRSELKASMRRLRFPCLLRSQRLRRWTIGNLYAGKVTRCAQIQDGAGDCAFF